MEEPRPGTPRMQAASTICFRRHSREEALRGLAEAGFANVEIGAVRGYVEHMNPDDVSSSAIGELQESLRRHGLRAVSISGHSEMHTAEGMERHRRLLHACSELGALVVNTYTGDMETGEEAAGFTQEERMRFIESAYALGDEAQRLGVLLCIENDSHSMPTGEVGHRVLREIGHPCVRMNYDAANAVAFGGASVEDDIEYALPVLGHLHLKDQRGGKGVFDFPPLGEGDLDLRSLLSGVEDSGFTGPVSMEIIEAAGDGSPDWEACLSAAKRGKAYWDSLG